MKKQTKTKIPASQKAEDAAIEKALRQLAGKKAAKPYEVPAHLYQGCELRAYDGRPGAMDFQALPSLQGGKRVFRGDAA